ncbi:MAG TPA: secretin N-terminal domain-containing protein [Candidatus Rifleibacterium sp.]|nr:secretin N-terminal domain-containing protein [Candidatus Rifleibacterium sp.]HPT44493.1 secretin N-terminal domain-containing protein [Candidatus Rifleibacterium sp.]
MSDRKTLATSLFKLTLPLCFVAMAGCGIAVAQTRVIDPPGNPFKKQPLIRNVQGSVPGSQVSPVGRPQNLNPGMPPIVRVTPPADQPAKPAVDINAAEIIEPSSGSGSDEIAINFEAVDLMSLVRYMSQETGRGFIINQPLQGDVTIISPVRLNKEEALAMLESILQVRGYTAVASGKMYKIVLLSDAKVAGTETRTSSELGSLGDDDTLITQIIPLERTSVEEASKILQTLLPRDASMLLFPPSNTIVLTGRSVNIKRALEVLLELEKGLLKPGLDIVPLKFSAADDLKAQLEKIISSGGVERDTIKGGVTFITDKRSNSLLVLTSPDNFTRVRSLIDRLDTSTTDARPELTKFFALKYADETETVKQLEDILGFTRKDTITSASESAIIETTRLVPIKRTRSIMVTARSEDIMKRIESLLEHLDSAPVRGSGDVKVIKVVNAEAKVLAETLAKLVQQTEQANADGNTSSTRPKALVNFVAEEHTNSIIMTGPPQQFPQYESILASLDIMRHQILVEVLITEVSGQLTDSLGIEWNVFNFNAETWRAFGGTNYDLKGNPLNNSGFQLGLIQEAVKAADLSSGDATALSKIKAMVKAYHNNSNFKILSAPQILSTDNQEAKISVGEVVALPQGFTQDRDTGRFDLTNFKYEDVGIVLGLTPRVNSNDLVTLKIDQEIKKRQEENLYEFNVPVLTKRQMQTTITVPNHRTIVIGGLMREDKTKVTERVPFLSKIPLIGEAFKNTRNVTQKTNLLVFITPHILSTPDEVLKFEEARSKITEEARLAEQRVVADEKLKQQDNHFRERAKKAFERLQTGIEKR